MTLPTNLSHADVLALKQKVYSESLLEFVKAYWPFHHPNSPLKMNWHIEAICDHLEAQSRGQIQRLIINVPPGAGKSLLTGVYWPCWEWTHSPHVQILATAASEDLILRDNQRARWLLESPDYQDLFPLELKQDSNSNAKFTNESFGYRSAVPFTSMTGHRGDRVIIDDAISASNATSDTLREKVNQTYFGSITTRLNQPKSSTVTIIQQRLHEQDLVGAILEKDSRFETLILPMEYVPRFYTSSIGFTDPRKKEGELLFPEHWGKEEISAYRDEGEYKYAAQFQQNPVPSKGGFFERSWFNRYAKHELPKNLHHYMTSDHSTGMSKKNDYQVIRVWGVDSFKNLWLVDSFRDVVPIADALGIQASPSGQLGASGKGALAFIERYKPLCWFAEADNTFKGIYGTLRDTMLATQRHCRIEMISTKSGSKHEKAAAYQAMASMGKVYLPQGVVGDVALDEYQRFGVSGKDDQVDADSILPRMIHSAHAGYIEPPAPKKRPDDYWTEDEGQGGKPENYHFF